MGALRFALLLCLRLRAQPERGGNRVHAPYCLVNGGGTRTERKGAGGNTPQVGDNMWTAAQPRIEGGREPSLEWGSTSMEGTSGAAERASLRGAAREAALAPVAAVKAVSFPGGLASSSRKPDEPRELPSGPAGRSRNRASGAPRLRASASRLARWARHGRTPARVCPAGSASPAGIATSSTTAGVRADRVGVKLPLRAIATEGAGKSESRLAPDP
jgi:hypothetical protein